MAGKLAKAGRRADVLKRLSAALNVEQAELQLSGRGDPELAMIVTLERVADAVEGLATKDKDAAPLDVEDVAAEADAPLTIETVVEKPLKTVETVEIVPSTEVAESGKRSTPRGKRESE